MAATRSGGAQRKARAMGAVVDRESPGSRLGRREEGAARRRRGGRGAAAQGRWWFGGVRAREVAGEI